MDVKGSTQSCKQIEAQALAVPVFKDEKADKGFLKELEQAAGGLITTVIKAEEFRAKEGETAYFHLTTKGLKARRLLLIGCGDKSEYKAAQISQMAGTATRFLRSKNVKSVAIAPCTDGDAQLTAETVAEGAIIGLFEPDKYRSQEKVKHEL